MAGGTGSKGETEAMVDDVANNLKNITTLIPDLQRTLDQQKRANAELEREKRDAAKAAADQLSAHARAAETKEKQAEGEKKKADAQIAQLTAQLKAMTGERDGALADAEQKQGSLNEQLAWRQSANEPTITFLQAMMAHKLLTGCAPTSALGDAEFAGLANVQKNIESNKIPDLQRAARELAEVKEGLQAAGFLADAKVAVSANQLAELKTLLADALAVQQTVALADAGAAAAALPGVREALAAREAEVAELGPFRDQAERLAREGENQTAAIASLEAKSEMWEGECASRDKRIKCAEDENATLKKNLAAVEKELAEIQKSARTMEKTLAEFHTKARGLVEAAPPPSEGRAAAGATARLASPGAALPPIADTVSSPPAGARFDPKATTASAKKPGKSKGLGVSALRST